MTPDASEYAERDDTERDIDWSRQPTSTSTLRIPVPRSGMKTEEEVLRYLTDYVDVDELMQSILSAGGSTLSRDRAARRQHRT